MLLVGIIAVVFGYGIWIYNRLVRDRNMVSNGWSDIDVQLKRRHDLVPRLVTAVDAYADYERATLEAVTTLRAQSMATNSLAGKAGIEEALEGAVSKLIVLAEDYPDLKADANFRDLQEQLVEVEDHLQHARRFYNGAVRNLNTRIESFPDLVVARLLAFSRAEFFEADAEARANVRVSL